MIHPDRAPGIVLVTDNKELAEETHALRHHAPSREVAAKIVRMVKAIRTFDGKSN